MVIGCSTGHTIGDFVSYCTCHLSHCTHHRCELCRYRLKLLFFFKFTMVYQYRSIPLILYWQTAGAQGENTPLFVKNASRIHERNIYWLFCALWPSLVLPTPCCAPLSIIHTLLALTNAPPPLAVCSPSIVHAPTICCSFNPIHSWFVLIHTCSTLCALSLCLLLLFLLWLMLYIWVPLGCLCLFTLIWPCVPLVYADSPLFAPTDAIPAVVATAHTHALTLALGSCVPTLHASLLFVVPYL